jgi:hypothetical protein
MSGSNKLMLNRSQVTAIVGVAGLALAVQLVLQRGLVPSSDWTAYISPAVSAVLVGLSIFDRWAWRWPLVRVLGGSRPDLRGIWKGTVVSSWVNPETNEPLPPIEAYLVVRQTFSTLSLRLHTAESWSESSTADVLRASDATCQVAWVHRNDPRMTVRHRSEIHYGAGCLRIVGQDNPTGLEGHYWTDRGTKGEMHFSSRVWAVADNFSVARTAFSAHARSLHAKGDRPRRSHS